jgi:hypothetical protein
MELGAPPMYASGRQPLNSATYHRNFLRPKKGPEPATKICDAWHLPFNGLVQFLSHGILGQVKNAMLKQE